MKISVLDHGYVEFVEAWGRGKDTIDKVITEPSVEFGGYTLPAFKSDMEAGIVEAARQSTQGSFRGWEKDAKLLEYLYSHNHMTPFEFAGMVIEVQAPIFVFREWHRHRTQSYNEMSARYEPLPDLYYVPTVERLLMKGAKQGGGTGKELTHDEAVVVRRLLESQYHSAEYLYKAVLDEGTPKELARCIMPVGHYSRMRASANLRNWLAFLTLRMDPAAQWEIRQFANAVTQIIAQNFPRTYELFADTLKAPEMP